MALERWLPEVVDRSADDRRVLWPGQRVITRIERVRASFELAAVGLTTVVGVGTAGVGAGLPLGEGVEAVAVAVARDVTWVADLHAPRVQALVQVRDPVVVGVG